MQAPRKHIGVPRLPTTAACCLLLHSRPTHVRAHTVVVTLAGNNSSPPSSVHTVHSLYCCTSLCSAHQSSNGGAGRIMHIRPTPQVQEMTRRLPSQLQRSAAPGAQPRTYAARPSASPVTAAPDVLSTPLSTTIDSSPRHPQHAPQRQEKLPQACSISSPELGCWRNSMPLFAQRPLWAMPSAYPQCTHSLVYLPGDRRARTFSSRPKNPCSQCQKD